MGTVFKSKTDSRVDQRVLSASDLEGDAQASVSSMDAKMRQAKEEARAAEAVSAERGAVADRLKKKGDDPFDKPWTQVSILPHF